MGAVVVVGAQWGDEGKGKIVDIYAEQADLVVRYGGGANAGHTLVVGGEQVVFHLVPSGALHQTTRCVLGQGTVIDPAVLLDELDVLAARGLYDPERFLVSERAFVVLPQHCLIDELRERQEASIGTTKRGIGPAYEDKVGRRGVRVGDLLSRGRLEGKLHANLLAWQPTVERLGGELPDLDEVVERFLAFGERLRPIVGDASESVRQALESGKRVLMEGAQGALLDLDMGTYPFVTSSSTVAGGACTGAGIGPTDIGSVVGISKAYATRVGNGPFPTEMSGPQGDALREAGAEFGATTGRPRRCGWLDLPALKLAVRANGLSGLALTKIDVLTGMDEIRVCTHYELDGETLELPPYDGLDRVEPVYRSLPGWSESIEGCRKLDELPKAARNYIDAIEHAVGCPVWLVSVGPDREQTIRLHEPWSPGA